MIGRGKILPGCIYLVMGSQLSGQSTNNQETHTYNIFRTPESINVDRELTGGVWSATAKVGDFGYAFPFDDSMVETESQTEVYVSKLIQVWWNMVFSNNYRLKLNFFIIKE